MPYLIVFILLLFACNGQPSGEYSWCFRLEVAEPMYGEQISLCKTEGCVKWQVERLNTLHKACDEERRRTQ